MKDCFLFHTKVKDEKNENVNDSANNTQRTSKRLESSKEFDKALKLAFEDFESGRNVPLNEVDNFLDQNPDYVHGVDYDNFDIFGFQMCPMSD